MHSFLVNECSFESRRITLICLYVDDLLIAGSSKQDTAWIKGELIAKFEMKDLGKAAVMLEVEIYHNGPRKKLFINQSEDNSTILEGFCMDNSKPVATPMESNGL